MRTKKRHHTARMAEMYVDKWIWENITDETHLHAFKHAALSALSPKTTTYVPES